MSEPFLAEVRIIGGSSTFQKVHPVGTRGVFPSIVGYAPSEVAGFEAPAVTEFVADLPTGVGVPWEIVLRLRDAETMRSWLELGREVHNWCAGNGHGDVEWELDGDGLPVVPSEIACGEVPEPVTAWVAGAADAAAAMARLFPAD